MLGTELAVSMDICKGDCIAFCIFVHSVGHSFRGLVFTLDFIFISKDGCRPEKRDPCSSPPCKRLKQGNYGKVFICVQSQTLEKLVIQNYISLSCIFAISLVPFLVMSSNSVKTAKYNMRSIIYIYNKWEIFIINEKYIYIYIYIHKCINRNIWHLHSLSIDESQSYV